MPSPELHMLYSLAEDLSTAEARARASLPGSQTVIGLGRFVIELGPDVGVFVRGTVDRSDGTPNGLIVNFVDRDPETRLVNTAGEATYRPHEGIVTVRDTSSSKLSVTGLIKAVYNTSLVRGDTRYRSYRGDAFCVAEGELDLLADFAYGDAATPTYMHSFGTVGRPGNARGIEISPVPGI